VWTVVPSVFWHCWLGVRKSIQPVKIEWWGTGVVICLECGANDLHMVQLMPLPPIISCFSKIQNGLPFWCWLTQVVLEKKAVKRMYVCMLSVDGDANAAAENRNRIRWNKFRQLVPLLTNNNISLKVRGRLYGSCVWSSMLHGSETWPVRNENVEALQQADMRMVRWMCGIKLQDRVRSKGLRERLGLGLDDIISVLQWNRLWWYGHVLRKEDNDWVKKCMEYEVQGARPRGRPKKTWIEIVEKDYQVCGWNREDAMDRSRWMKQIGRIDDHNRCDWVNVSSGTSSPMLSRTKSIQP